MTEVFYGSKEGRHPEERPDAGGSCLEGRADGSPEMLVPGWKEMFVAAWPREI
jgi:hypothetical protein